MRLRASALVLSAALAFAAGAPGRAQTTTGTPMAGALASAQDAAGRNDCAGVLAALDPLVPTLATGPDRLMIQRMRLLCLGAAGRTEELSQVQRELAQAMPRDGVVRAIGALIAADENRFGDAADQIASLADSNPKSLEMLTGAAVRAISLRLVEEHKRDARDRMYIALARADWEPADIPELRTGFAEGAIGALLSQGQPAEAEGLLERIDEPELLSSMLIDRHYASLWPALDARMGPGGGTAVDRYARDKLSAFADSPDSEVTLRDATGAMLLLGRYQDVIEMSDGVAVAPGMSRDAVRILLYRARALAALRRNQEADRLLGAFVKLDMRGAPAAVTALVSYAEFLDETGQPARALDVVAQTRTRAGEMLSGLGQRWIDRTEVCTLSALGRTAEATGAMNKLKTLADQNAPAVIEALLCAHRDAEASKLALKTFANDDEASDLLIQFQPGASLWASAPSRLRDLWGAFLTRPEIKAAFEKRGRILPKTYWPGTKPRDIPRRPSNGAVLT